MMGLSRGAIASSRRRGGYTMPDWSTLLEHVYIMGESALTASSPLALNTFSTSPEDGDGLYPVTLATVGSTAHGLASGETFDVRRSTSSLIYNGAADTLPSAYQAAIRLAAPRTSEVGATLSMIEKREAMSNLGSAGSADLAQATVAAQPRLLASPARLEFDGVDDLMAQTTAIAAAPATIYMAVLFRAAVAQTDATQRGIGGFGDTVGGRLFFRLGDSTGTARYSAGAQTYAGTYVATYGSDIAAGSLHLGEVLWVGTTITAYLDGVELSPRTAGPANSANLAASLPIILGRFPATTVFGQFGAEALWLGTTDRRTEVRAYAAAQGVTF